MRLRYALRIALGLAVTFAGCDKAERQAAADNRGEETAMSEPFQYGFRYDPVEVIAAADGLDAALVRTLLLETPRPGDAATIEAHFAEVFAAQKPDGSFEDEHDRPPAVATAAKLYGLFQKGCSPDRPEMQRAIGFLEDFMAELPADKFDEVPGDAVYVMCMLGKGDHPAIRARLEHEAAEMPELWG